ncbi:MAG: CYTH domain-containing protein [Microbacterium sp.]|uniref:CYTH domain-containing protein n=1 Tax=Microbacterium sp. TaxID=51671 RepID=UPI003A89372D
MSTAGPTRSVEVEAKVDVEVDTPLLDLTSLPGVVTVGAAEVRSLDARYLDTARLVLAAHGVALRRRTGGGDAGWHLKGPLVDGGRTEVHWPLGDPNEPPAGVYDELSRVIAEPLDALGPIARIRNERTAFVLYSEEGNPIAEFADDHVDALDLRTGTERRWREWELELLGGTPSAPPDVLRAFVHVAQAVGAQPAASTSKLARALGR